MPALPEKKDPLSLGFALRVTHADAAAEEQFMQQLRALAALPIQSGLPRAKIQATPVKDPRTGEYLDTTRDYKLFVNIMPLIDDAVLKSEGKEAAQRQAEEKASEETIKSRRILEAGLKNSGLRAFLSDGPAL